MKHLPFILCLLAFQFIVTNANAQEKYPFLQSSKYVEFGLINAVPIGEFGSKDIENGSFAMPGWGISFDSKTKFVNQVLFNAHLSYQWNDIDGEAMSEKTKEILDNFWELIDEFLNAILFMLVGFSLLIVEFNQSALIAGIIMVPALLCIRYMSVFIPVTILQRFRSFSPGTVNILTWGGLRGGLSLAMCLSLPANDLRDFMLLVVYCIVLFSILVQTLTIGKLAQRYTSPNK